MWVVCSKLLMFGLVIALLFSSHNAIAVSADSPTATPRPPEPDPTTDIVYTVPDMDEVQIEKDVVYKTDGKVSLYFDAYFPPDLKEGEARPAILAGRYGNKIARQHTSWGKMLAASGYVVIMFEYRAPRSPVLPDQILGDWDDLIKYVHDHATELHIDDERLAVFGVSGQVLHNLSAAFRGLYPEIRAAVAYYGPMEQIGYPAISPLSYLNDHPENIPPLFIAQAGKDSSRINNSLEKFVKEAQAKNIILEYVIHPDGLHGFDFLNDDDQTREIIQQTLDFLKKYLSEPTPSA
jgi:acetyl esterase/lipase